MVMFFVLPILFIVHGQFVSLDFDRSRSRPRAVQETGLVSCGEENHMELDGMDQTRSRLSSTTRGVSFGSFLPAEPVLKTYPSSY